MPSLTVKNHPGLYLALAVYLLLALTYFFVVPIFEGPDEWTHTGHVKYIAEGNGLPVMLPGQGIWGGQQPPLYYALGALLVQPFELEAFDGYAERNQNPHASAGYALDPGNKNNYLHAADEAFPYGGLSLTVHVLRLYSMLFGLITVFFIYLTALELVEARRRGGEEAMEILGSSGHHLLASSPRLFATSVALFVASQPMFTFITATVANEPANIAFCAIGLWLVQRYVLYGPSQRWLRAAALGIVLGLIALSKMTGLALGLVAVIAFLQAAIASRKTPGAARLLWRDGLLVGGLFLLVAGWWYWRNYRLYGDFFQTGLYKLYFNVDPQTLSLSQFLYTLSTGEVSFWATFGWLNIVAPEWLYSVYRIISRIGLLGLVIAAIIQFSQHFSRSRPTSSPSTSPALLPAAQPPRRLSSPPSSPLPRLLIHLTFPLALAFSLTRLVSIEGGLQGRQLLPALGAIAIVVMWGWWFLMPPRWQRPVLGLLFAGLLGLAVWLPLGVVAPAYSPSPLLTEAQLPANLPRLDWRYNDEIMLLGVEIGLENVRPGQRLPVTAYWQALKPASIEYSVFVHLFGADAENVGQFNTYPGLGLRPASGLQPGQIWADTYPVLINGGSQTPSRLQVSIGLYDFEAAGRPGIAAIAPDGQMVPSTVPHKPLKLVPQAWPTPQAGPPLADFSDNISLNSFQLENCMSASADCQLNLEWLSHGRPSTDYTVFVQLWQDGQHLIGFDRPPLNNNYPTSLWQANEVIIDSHPLDLARLSPGEYQLYSGLYNFSSGERLPASQNGTPVPDYAIELGKIVIKP